MSRSVTAEEQTLIKKLVDRGINRLTPRISPKGVTYPELGDVEDWSRLNALLLSLSDKLLLEKTDVDRAIFCPSCGSPHVYSKYACPHDQSIFIKKNVLAVHTPCGYQGELGDFKKTSSPVCPQCGKQIQSMDDEVKIIGFNFTCETNGHRFEKPAVVHFCPGCGGLFDYRTADVRPLYAYSPTRKARDMVEAGDSASTALEPVAELMERRGYSVEYNVELPGSSGNMHGFDMLAEKTGRRVAFDYTYGESNDLVTLLGKKLDVAPVVTVMVDLGGGPDMKKLGKVYDIPVVSVRDTDWESQLDMFLEALPDEDSEKKPRRRGILRR